MTNTVAIVSGGLDSVTMLHYLVKLRSRKPDVIIFDYGQKHSCEVGRAVWQASQLNLTYKVHQINTIFVYGRDHYVPNRNMIFLSLAVAYAESIQAKTVYCGAQAHANQIWDTTIPFLNRMNSVLRLNDRDQVQLEAPFGSMSKTEILELGIGIGVDYSMTWSCYAGKSLACGVCPVCKDRLEAFEACGVPDPLKYETFETAS